MILRPRRTKANLWPSVILLCDAPDPDDPGKTCAARELFPYGTDGKAINHWQKAHGWTSVYKGHGKFTDRCPICERLRQAPAAYYDRLSA